VSNGDTGRQDCKMFMSQLDLYIDGRLPPDALLECETHLRECPACALELESRKKMRAQLKPAVQSVPTPPYLEAKVRASLREPQPARRWWAPAAAAAAVTVLSVGAITGYHFGHFRLTPGSQESYIASVSGDIGTLMRVGLGDHVHCAVFRKYPQNPPSPEEMASAIGPDFAGVIPLVREHAPGDLRLVLAHRCTYHDRHFVHLILKNDSRLLSVIFTRKSEGPPVTAGDLAPAWTEGGLPTYQSSVQRFQIASFQSRDYLVYIISDTPAQQNLATMQAMAPSLSAYLRKLES